MTQIKYKIYSKMKRALQHIELKKCFNPSVDYFISGASNAVS